jgi:hypothetical protein
MATLNAKVNARGWRRMPPTELSDLILTIRRQAARQHLSASEWHLVDRMRRRLAELLKDAVSKANLG